MAVDVLDAGDKIVSIVSGKSIKLTSDRVSSPLPHATPGDCPWRRITRELVLSEGWAWPLPILADRIVLNLRFEYNGCQLHAVGFSLSEKCVNRWFNDSASFEITALGHSSNIGGPTGCPAGCSQSSCVEFQITLVSTFDWARLTVLTWEVRILGNGDVFVTR